MSRNVKGIRNLKGCQQVPIEEVAFEIEENYTRKVPSRALSVSRWFKVHCAIIRLILLLPATTSLAAHQYFLHLWQTEDGLPQNAVSAIVQSREGYLWLGTYSGLVRFDGARFVLFDNSNTPQLKSSRVMSLYEDTKGTLWIGHETGELTRLKNGRFEALPSGKTGKAR